MDDDDHDRELFGLERARIRSDAAQGPPPREVHQFSLRAHTTEASEAVLARAKEVLDCVLRNSPEDWPDNRRSPWPSLDDWERLLPQWFVDACASETTEEKIAAQARRIAKIPREHRELVSQHVAPSVGDWTSTFAEDRSWLWWDASILTEDQFEVRYVAFDHHHTRWPLSWLLVAAGAWRLDHAEADGGASDDSLVVGWDRFERHELGGSDPSPSDFQHYAMLRVASRHGLDLEKITADLGLAPTRVIRRGLPNGLHSSHPASQDVWLFRAPVPESADLHVHIDALWERLRPHAAVIESLKAEASVVVHLGYLTSMNCAGLTIPPRSLEMFRRLGLDFQVNITVLPDDDDER